jgi:hypothetical protein
VKQHNSSLPQLIGGIVFLAALGGVLGHLAGIGVVELWFRPGGAEPARDVAAAPYVFTIVGCLFGTLAGMGWAAFAAARRAIYSEAPDTRDAPHW